MDPAAAERTVQPSLWGCASFARTFPIFSWDASWRFLCFFVIFTTWQHLSRLVYVLNLFWTPNSGFFFLLFLSLTVAAVMFAVRVVTADYYLASPVKDLDVCYSEFRQSNVKKVPVVRIFGATPAGQFGVAACFWFFLMKGNGDCGFPAERFDAPTRLRRIVWMKCSGSGARQSPAPSSFVFAYAPVHHSLGGDSGGDPWLQGSRLWHASPTLWFYLTETAN